MFYLRYVTSLNFSSIERKSQYQPLQQRHMFPAKEIQYFKQTALKQDFALEQHIHELVRVLVFFCFFFAVLHLITAAKL